MQFRPSRTQPKGPGRVSGFGQRARRLRGATLAMLNRPGCSSFRICLAPKFVLSSGVVPFIGAKIMVATKRSGHCD
jgi:hypothetical protein